MYSRIRALREDRDLTQSQVAKILHCSQQVYSNYELGQRDIPTDILIKHLHLVYGVCPGGKLDPELNDKRRRRDARSRRRDPCGASARAFPRELQRAVRSGERGDRQQRCDE